MKNNLIVIIILVLFTCSCRSNQTEPEIKAEKIYKELSSKKYDAVALNNQISSIQKGSVAIVETVFKSDTLTLDQNLSDAVFELEVSSGRLKSLAEEHEMVAYFSEAVMALIQFYMQEFEGDFKGVVNILKKKDWSENDKLILNDYDQTFANSEALLFKDILVRQDSFANYFNIQLAN